MRNVTVTDSGALRVGGLVLGELRYEALGEDVYNTTEYVCDQVFGGKGGSAKFEGGGTTRSVATLEALYVGGVFENENSQCEFWAKINISGVGAPTEAWTHFTLGGVEASTLDVELRIVDKIPTRMNEAGWMFF